MKYTKGTLIRTIIIFVVLVIGILLVRLLSPEDSWICADGAWAKHGNPSPPAPLTGCGVTADPKNAIYEINGQKITLVNGLSEISTTPDSASKLITRYFGNNATGDLNNDGKNDVGVILTQDGGGTGTFYYAVALLKTDSGHIGTNAILLGDRIAPQTTEIKNGVLIVNYTDRLPGEPFSAKPSVGKSKYLEIKNGKLAEAPIYIESPVSGAEISSPLTVSGVAKGPWFFEASFPLILTDWDGKIIAQSHATAQGEWMTTDYVRFSGTINFEKPTYGIRGTLVFRKDNPSGLPQNDDAREITVFFK